MFLQRLLSTVALVLCASCMRSQRPAPEHLQRPTNTQLEANCIHVESSESELSPWRPGDIRHWNYGRAGIEAVVFALDVDATSTCGTTPRGTAMCWGRTDGISENPQQFLGSRATNLSLESRVVWSSQLSGFVPIGHGHERWEALEEGARGNRLRDSRTPQRWRTGWAGVRIDPVSRRPQATWPYQGHSTSPLYHVKAVVRTASQLCIRTNDDSIRCGRWRNDESLERSINALDSRPSVEMDRSDSIAIGATGDAVCVVDYAATVWCRDDYRVTHGDPTWELFESRAEELVITRSQACTLNDRGVVSCRQFGGPPELRRTVVMPIEFPIVQLVAGEEHICARDAHGRAWCWGEPSFGRLGTFPTPVGPQRIPLPSPVLSAVAGWAHTCALTIKHEVFCWGLRSYGQTGEPAVQLSPFELPSARFRTTPFPHRVSVPFEPTTLRSEPMRTCAIAGSREYCWGVELPPTAVIDPPDHHCALAFNGRVTCEGDNRFGQLGLAGNFERSQVIVPTLISMVGVIDGVSHSCAWDRCGGLFCWGSNELMQLGLPRERDPTVPQRVRTAAVLEFWPSNG